MKFIKVNSLVFSTIIVLIFFLNTFAQAQHISKVWVADNGDGTYKNPVLHADYSDPDAIRVGDDYYLTASSFDQVPGLPILHSKDLVNWELINYVFQKQNRSKFSTNRITAAEFGRLRFVFMTTNFTFFIPTRISEFI